MSTYPLVPLGEVLTLDLDQVQVEPESTFELGGVYSFGRGLFTRGPLSGSETSYKVLNRLHRGQLVLSRLKAFEGAVAVVPQELDSFVLSPEFPTFSHIGDKVDPLYLTFLCKWPEFWTLLQSTSKGIGARRERVHPDRFLALKIPLPDIDEQRRVAGRIEHLSAFDNRLSQLGSFGRQYPDAVLASARKYVIGVAGDADSRRAPTKYRDMVLGELADFVNGTSYDTGQLTSNGLPIIRISNITDPSSPFLYTTQEFDSRFIVSPGDLLVSWSASFKSIIWPGPKSVLNQHIFRVTEAAGNDRRYIRHLIEALFDKMREQQVGIGMMHLRRDAFLEQPVRVPDLREQSRIADVLDRIERSAGEVRMRHSRVTSLLSALRVSVLNQAFAGLL